jgi:hemoglobin-like flavoprotein
MIDSAQSRANPGKCHDDVLRPPVRTRFFFAPYVSFPREEQARKLAHVLRVVVSGLDRRQQILATVEELGRRHLTYGVREQHYATVGEALLWTLQTGLGDAFTAEVREAWACAYLFLASAMQRAAANAVPQPA